jgi:hypothetical protein
MELGHERGGRHEQRHFKMMGLERNGAAARAVISILGINELKEMLVFCFLMLPEVLKTVKTLFYQKNMKNINFIIR